MRRQPEPSQRGIESIVGNRSISGTNAGEEIFAAAGNRFQFGQHVQDLLRERHFMGTTHLRLRRRDGPDGRLEIEFLPFSHSQFARAREHMRQHLQRDSHSGLAVMGIDRAKEAAKCLGLQDRRPVLRLRRYQGAAKIDGHVPLRAPGHDRVAKDRAEGAAKAVSGKTR